MRTKKYWKYTELRDGIKNEIETISSCKADESWKNFKKIKFNSDDNLPLIQPSKFPTLTIIIRSIFEEDGKFYPQIYLSYKKDTYW